MANSVADSGGAKLAGSSVGFSSVVCTTNASSISTAAAAVRATDDGALFRSGSGIGGVRSTVRHRNTGGDGGVELF
jgi:hypothetical protein